MGYQATLDVGWGGEPEDLPRRLLLTEAVWEVGQSKMGNEES